MQTPITGVAAHPGRGGGKGLSAVNRSHSRLQIVTLCQVLFFHRQNACGKNYGNAKSAGLPKGTECALCQANRQMFDRNRPKKFLWKTLWRMWKTQCYPHLSAAVSTAVKFENGNLTAGSARRPTAAAGSYVAVARAHESGSFCAKCWRMVPHTSSAAEADGKRRKIFVKIP